MNEPIVIYRCVKCGTLRYEPKGDCKCWKGPAWERGSWFVSGTADALFPVHTAQRTTEGE